MVLVAAAGYFLQVTLHRSLCCRYIDKLEGVIWHTR